MTMKSLISAVLLAGVSVVLAQPAFAERKTEWDLKDNKATADDCGGVKLSCDGGFLLKSAVVTVPEKWPAIPIAELPDAVKYEKSFLGIKAICTCQYKKALAPECKDAGRKVYNLNPLNKDYCSADAGINITVNPPEAKCSTVTGADKVYRANGGVYAAAGGYDKCYYYAKPKKN